MHEGVFCAFFCIFAVQLHHNPAKMLSSVLYLLPCMVSLLWFLSFVFRVKDKRQILYTLILALYVFYYATYALYISPMTDYETMVRMDAINIPVIMALEAAIVLYMYFNYRRPQFAWVQMLLLLPAIVLGTIVNMLYFILGFDSTARIIELADKGLPIPAEYNTEIFRMYNFFTEPFVNVCSTVFIIAIFTLGIITLRKGGYHLGDGVKFLFQGKASSPQKISVALMMMTFVLLIPMVLLGRRYLFQHDVVGILLTMCIAAVIHCMSHVEFYASHLKQVTLYDLSHIRLDFRENKDAATSDVLQEEANGGTERETRKELTRRKTKAVSQLQELLETKRIYRDENLTSSTVAEMLGLSRSSFSALVTDTYDMPFRELLNEYRIEHAKQYMLAHPTATQETVALESGFRNAQYLSHKFKQIEGETPAMWLAKNSKDNLAV